MYIDILSTKKLPQAKMVTKEEETPVTKNEKNPLIFIIILIRKSIFQSSIYAQCTACSKHTYILYVTNHGKRAHSS